MSLESICLCIPILPLLSSLLPLLEKSFRKTKKDSCTTSYPALVLGLALPLLLIVVLFPRILEGGAIGFTLGGWSDRIGIQYRLDGPALFALALVALVALASGLYAAARGGYSPTFWFLYLVCVFALQSTLLAADFFHLYVCLELMAMTSYSLIAYKRNPAALYASFNYLIISSVSIVLYLLGLFLLYNATGTLSMEGVARVLRDASESSRSLASYGLVFIAGGLGVRSAYLPFHGWLPDAHANAPHPVSALLSGAMIKVSFFAQWRILTIIEIPWLKDSFLWIGVFSALLGVVFALAQSDVKRLLAWHSISQIGYILAAFGIATSEGLWAAGLHAGAHAVFKTLLFLSVGSLSDIGGSRDIHQLRGIGRRFPELAIGFIFGALSIAAIPPFIGAVTKDLVLHAVGGGLPGFLLTAASIGTAASFAKLSLVFFARPSPNGQASPSSFPASELKSLRAATKITVLPLGLLCLVSGILAPLLLPSLNGLLAPASLPPSFLFTVQGVVKSLAILGAGFILAKFVLSPGGKKISRSLEYLGSGSQITNLFTLLGIAALFLLAFLSEYH